MCEHLQRLVRWVEEIPAGFPFKVIVRTVGQIPGDFVSRL